MAILAGIDEAGFGPILGPLVVSASIFGLPASALDRCLWEALAGAVTRKALRRSSALPVGDSKTMHVRTDGPVHLERGVLGMLRQAAGSPRGLRELLRLVAPGALAEMDRYPWYAGQDLPLPRQADGQDLSLRVNALTEAMARAGLRLHAIRAEVVLEGEYNRLVAATRNKAVALFGVTSRLIAHVLSHHAADPSEPVRILLDRQGGRLRYVSALLRMYPGANVKIVEESPRRSAYLLRRGQRRVEISFLTNGEDHSLPVALASMVSKYLRELFMECLNRWWVRRVPGLKATAGYYTDGRRFLKDIDVALAAEAFPASLLVRSR